MDDLRARRERVRDEPDQLWTYGEFARWVGAPERSVQKWVTDGTGANVLRFGRHARIRAAGALAWLDQKAAA